MVKWLTLSWTALLARGVFGVAFGAMTLAWPEITVFTLVLLFGLWALADGVAAIGQAWSAKGTGARIALILMGVVSLAAAFFAIAQPGLTAVTLTWILGIWLAVRGVFEIVGTVAGPFPQRRSVQVLSGLLDVAIGVVLMANPGRSALGLAALIGLLALVWGLAFIALAYFVRRGAEKPEAGSLPRAAAT